VAAAHQVVHLGRVVEPQVLEVELRQRPERAGAVLQEVPEALAVAELGPRIRVHIAIAISI